MSNDDDEEALRRELAKASPRATADVQISKQANEAGPSNSAMIVTSTGTIGTQNITLTAHSIIQGTNVAMGDQHVHLGDNTSAQLEMIDALVEGRRTSAPALGLVHDEYKIGKYDNESIRIDVYLSIQNRGSTYAEKLYTGVLFGSLICDSHDLLEPEHHLAKRVSWTLEPPTLRRGLRLDPRDMGTATSMIPFTRRSLGYWARLPRVFSALREWTSVVYAGTSTGSLQWWEVRARISQDETTVDWTVEEIRERRLPHVTHRAAADAISGRDESAT